MEEGLLYRKKKYLRDESGGGNGRADWKSEKVKGEDENAY